MKNIVLSQREERDKLLSIDYQQRYIFDTATLFRDARPIKLITGPRRAGKSVLALQMLNGVNFAYLNFDDKALLEGFSESAVEQSLNEVYPDYQYLLLDEIQNLEGWNIWVEKLYRRGANIVITGSNANMLSDDIAAVLSGRFLELRLFPFSAGEYLNYKKVEADASTPEEISRVNIHLDSFLNNGGFPEMLDTPKVVEAYLSSLYDTIIVKDIVRRYKVRKVQDLYNVADWLLSNYTGTFSASSLADELGMKSTATIQKFCSYLQNTYLFQYLPRFDNKLRLMKKADRKVYIVDNGFIKARAFGLSPNMGHMLENLVFMELLKSGYDLKKYELFYYRSRNNKETDFVCRRSNRIEQLIQVCYDISEKKTRKRETGSLVECAKELKCHSLTIVTWNDDEVIEQDEETINVVSLRNWILASRRY